MRPGPLLATRDRPAKPANHGRLRAFSRPGPGQWAVTMSDHLLFPGDGEMARRMRAYPWRESPPGDPRDWPAVLATACRICLTSRFPMIVWWGRELRFLYNDAYLPLLGDKHPALGLRGDEVWPEIWDTIGPMLESVMRTGQATWSEDLLLPMRRHAYWEETYWTYSYSPLHDEDGTVRGVFTAVTDSTEQVVGRRRLAVLQDLGALTGRGHEVTEVCELVVTTLARWAEVVPFTAIYLRSPNTGGAYLAASSAPGQGVSPLPGGPGGWPVGAVLRGGSAVTLDDVAGRFGELPSGGWPDAPRQAMVLPLPGDAGGEPAGVIVAAASAGRRLDEPYRTFLGLVARQTAALVNGTVAYQAQLRRANELAELDRAKTTFFSNISHEFRTPLTLIMGPVEELGARLGPSDEAARAELDVIRRNSLRLGKLVNTLLDFSRLEAGRMRATWEPLDLAAFTAELASGFRSAIERAGLRYDVECRPLSTPVEVDREMWEKIVLNLISNAFKFTLDGSVRISLGEEDGQAVLTVADTGTGIPEAELPRLFDRFHRIENARARSNEGSGIGLALVRELVGLHDGTIGADSTEGEGTAFTVRLPFSHPVDARGTSAPLAAGPPPVPRSVPVSADPYLQETARWDSAGEPGTSRGSRVASGADTRVLIADDNCDMREYLERLLRPGYKVTAVGDGQAALESALASPPDIVLSDVMMPRLGGLELVAALRADSRTADVPVVLLSARAGEEPAIEGLAAGADDYLVKPFTAGELLARVRSTVELARMRGHHARWRAALVDSLHEAFFVCDDDGIVLEVNSAFGDLLGYGADGLPYGPPYPWWPSENADPDSRQVAEDAYRRIREDHGGSFTVPLVHRDGRRLWVSGSFNEVSDPRRGRVVVGTLRDVTADYYAIQRETALAAMSLAFSRAGTMDETLREALGELHRTWHARRAVAAVWTGTAQPEVTASLPGATWDGLATDVRAALTRLREQPPLVPVDEPGGAGIHVDHPGGALTIWIELASGHPLSAQDQLLLSLLGGRLGPALQRAHQGDQQRETALALQRAILGPAQLPAGFSVRYEPATRPLEVGGDWHDIVGLPDGRIAIVVGDCVGHDLGAATAMGQLRSAFRALLLENFSPSQVLSAMDRFVALVPGAWGTTAVCGILNPETGLFTYSAAGHPPGLVASRDGSVVLLDGARSFPLGVAPEAGRAEASHTLPPLSTLLVYTDGLVERRGRSIMDGIAEAGTVMLGGTDEALEELASQMMTRMAPAGGYRDDVAIVLYRHPAPLQMEFPADSGQLAPVRARLRGWLGGCLIGPQMAQAVLVAAGEACANAIEHGSRPGPGERIRLHAASSPSRLWLTISDSGGWRVPPREPPAHRGKGIPLMRALMSTVTVAPTPSGTTVTMDLRISHGHRA